MSRCLYFLIGLFLSHISFGQNSCPTLSSGFGSIVTTTDQAVSVSFNLNDYFSIDAGTCFSVSSSNGDAISFSLSGNSLSVNTKGIPGNGSLYIVPQMEIQIVWFLKSFI